MIARQDKENLKNFLLRTKHLITESPFERTEIFLKNNHINKKEFFEEIIDYQNRFDKVISDERQLLWTIL